MRRSWLKRSPFGYLVDKEWLALIVTLVESEALGDSFYGSLSWLS